MEGNSHPAPGAEPELDPTDTPPGEPVDEAPAPTSEDKSAAESDLRLAQAEYTKGQQTIAAIRLELGLDRKATRDDVLAAIRARAVATDEGDPAPEADPRLAEYEARAFAAELRVQDAIYTPIFGGEFATKGLELANTLRTTNDPEELMGALAAFVESYRGGGADPAAGASAAEGDQSDRPPADVGLPEGDQGPSASTSPAVRRGQESGTVSAVRAAFESARAAATRR